MQTNPFSSSEDTYSRQMKEKKLSKILKISTLVCVSLILLLVLFYFLYPILFPKKLGEISPRSRAEKILA